MKQQIVQKSQPKLNPKARAKKLAIFIIIGGMLVAGGVAFAQSDSFTQLFQKDKAQSKKQTQALSKQAQANADAQANAALSQSDSDGDGLTDAKELELGTDPKNPDTDGDGYTDKIEVDSKHDPLTKAENPAPTLDLTPDQKEAALLNLGSLQSALDGDPNSDISKKISDELTKQLSSNIQSYQLPTVDDASIKIDASVSPESYLKNIGQIIGENKYISSPTGSEDIASALSEGDEKSAAAVAAAFAKSNDSLKSIKIPADARDLHKKMLQITLAIETIASSIKADISEGNNTAIILEITKLSSVNQEYSAAIKKMQEYVSKHHVDISKL